MKNLLKEFTRWSAYRATFKELNKLSDRELNDIGFRRGEIKQIAFYAAYGSDALR